jgi:hypothetical protein
VRTAAASSVLIVGLFAASSATAYADNTREEHPCLGVWQGMGRNTGSQPWAIEMTVASTSTRCGGIEYDSPELDCGGPFSRCELDAASGRAVETYTHNVHCAPPGDVIFRCTGDVMEWEWRGNEVVRTRLRRVRRITPASTESASPEPIPNEGPAPSPPRDTSATPREGAERDVETPTPPDRRESPPRQPSEGERAGSCACSLAHRTDGGSALAALLLFSLVVRRRRRR